MKLNAIQHKGLSEFLNTVAAAWFSAGAISPLFINSEDISKIIFLSGIEIFMALLFLIVSLLLLRKVEL
jgi:hypothetical protein